MRPLDDVATMVGRELRHAVRYPVIIVVSVALPVLMLLLFVYVFGGLSVGPGNYVDFLTPGILMMTIAAGSAPSAISVATDAKEGIIDRFRAMPIARGAVLAGHVAGGLLRTMLAVVAVTGTAVVAGFRPSAGPAGWLAAAGVATAFAFALTWLSVGVGLAARTPTGANSAAQLIATVLPFLSSAFVPPASASRGIRWFVEHQPMTPVVDSLRALLTGAPAGGSVGIALAWCTGTATVGYLWAVRSYRRDA
ncbi:ABC transporter permease [Cryptosporangium sp. NPDC051539]|uniref:ABC transporter permease n=1 Tax=Cryptosporangium sp. NPDC051539 TaxID=3363962 RepID=UPI0037ABA5FD